MAADNPSSDRNLDINIQGNENESNIIVGDGNSIQVINVYNPVEVSPSGVRPSQSLSKQEYRWRQVLVDNVNHYWIEGVLERSLHNQVLIELGLEERIGAVASPLSGVEEFPVDEVKAFPEGTQVTDVFDSLGAGRTLLILGGPGAGKTITLLKLTQSLLTRMGDDLSQPVPVILNLSSWAKKRQSIEKWLVQELYIIFQVSKSLGKTWIKEEILTLCLDGLDEVAVQYRDDCVQALNAFMQTHGRTEIVICSRVKDYESLSYQLKLKNAIYVQPLTDRQIDWYTEKAGEKLLALRAILSHNTTIRKFASSPLILSVMSLAYQDYSLDEIPDVGSGESFQQRLFDTYIQRMFQRRGTTHSYDDKQAKHFLIWMAQRMVRASQTVFFIESMQPSWLHTRIQKLRYRLQSSFSFGLSVGISAGLIYGSSTVLYTVLTYGPASVGEDEILAGLAVVITFGLGSWMIAMTLGDIKPVETLKWSWQESRKSIRYGLIFGLIAGSIIGFIMEPGSGIVLGITLGSIVGIITGLIGGIKGPGMDNKEKPNQGIWKSARNAGIFVLIGFLFGILSDELFGWLIGWLGLNLGVTLGAQSSVKLVDGLIDGLVFGLVVGGSACFRHFSLRLMLYRLGYIPWNYARFLDYATERLFLQKVGGGYIFIHRMLLEHFAQMESKETK